MIETMKKKKERITNRVTIWLNDEERKLLDAYVKDDPDLNSRSKLIRKALRHYFTRVYQDEIETDTVSKVDLKDENKNQLTITLTLEDELFGIIRTLNEAHYIKSIGILVDQLIREYVSKLNVKPIKEKMKKNNEVGLEYTRELRKAQQNTQKLTGP